MRRPIVNRGRTKKTISRTAHAARVVGWPRKIIIIVSRNTNIYIKSECQHPTLYYLSVYCMVIQVGIKAINHIYISKCKILHICCRGAVVYQPGGVGVYDNMTWHFFIERILYWSVFSTRIVKRILYHIMYSIAPEYVV